MRRTGFIDGFIAALFILYCVEAGAFLVLAPWRDLWMSFVGWFPIEAARPLVARPIVRGAVSGFGLVHLVWGVHDLERLLARKQLRERESMGS